MKRLYNTTIVIYYIYLPPLDPGLVRHLLFLVRTSQAFLLDVGDEAVVVQRASRLLLTLVGIPGVEGRFIFQLFLFYDYKIPRGEEKCMFINFQGGKST